MRPNARPADGEVAFLGRDEASWLAVQSLWHQLFAASKTELWQESWQWLYGKNPFWDDPDTYPVVVYRSEGQPVGQLGLIPARVRLNGKWLDAAWCVDYHILPSHQRRGIGKKLLDCAASRIPLLLTLGQTDASFGLFVKAGWHGKDQHLILSRRFLRPISVALKRLGLPAPSRNPVVVSEIRRIQSEAGPVRVAVLQSLAGEPCLCEKQEDRDPDGQGIVARTLEFLEWRYTRHPKLRYTILKLTLCETGQVLAYAVVRFGWTGIYRKALLCEILPGASGIFSTHAGLCTAAEGPLAAFCKLQGAELFETEMSPRPEIRGRIAAMFSMTKPSLRFLYGMPRMEGCADLPVSSWRLSPGDCDADLFAGMSEADPWLSSR